MTKRMKKKLVAICISCAVVFTGPGMSMVTRAYADEITQDQQQDGNSANAQVSPGEDENNQADNTENSDDKLNDQNGQNQEDVVRIRQKNRLRKRRLIRMPKRHRMKQNLRQKRQ